MSIIGQGIFLRQFNKSQIHVAIFKHESRPKKKEFKIEWKANIDYN